MICFQRRQILTKSHKKDKAEVTSFNNVEKLLTVLDIFYKRPTWGKIDFSFSKFSQEFTSIMYGTNYEKIYRTARTNLDYDILLVDGSFFQFTITNNGSRYAYYQAPKKNISFQDFADKFQPENDRPHTKFELQDQFEKNYEQFVDEANPKEFVTPIRYDFDPKTHETSFYHSAAHIHIGFEQSMRIPLHCTLSPLDFVIFVLRMMYFESFMVGIKHDDIKDLFIKKNGQELDGDYFKPEEEVQLYLC